MKLLGHSAHQVLVVFPVGLLITSVIFEMLALATGSAQFWVVSYWLIASGLGGGLAAAVFGLLDYVRIPRRTRANRVGMLHGIGNAAVIVLFAASWWMRAAPDQAPSPNAVLLSLAGASAGDRLAGRGAGRASQHRGG